MRKECLICGSANQIPLVTGNKGVNHFICKECGLIYISPIPSKEFIESYYNENKSTNEQGVKLEQSKKKLGIIMAGLDRVAEYILNNSKFEGSTNENRSILEIGSSTGNLLNVFKHKGFKVKGIEPSKIASDYSKQNYKLDVINDVFEHAKINEKFDLVLCIHMLEHVENPLQFLSKIRKVMKKRGVLYIKVSNLYKPMMKLKYFFTPLHLINYSPRTLANMLALSKFRIIKLDLTGNYIDAFFVKDDNIKLKIDSREFEREMKFIKQYKRDYFLKLKFLTIFFKIHVYNKIVDILVKIFPFSWLQRVRKIVKR